MTASLTSTASASSRILFCRSDERPSTACCARCRRKASRTAPGISLVTEDIVSVTMSTRRFLSRSAERSSCQSSLEDRPLMREEEEEDPLDEEQRSHDRRTDHGASRQGHPQGEESGPARC